MRLASKERVSFRETQAFRWFRLRKRCLQYLRYRPDQAKTVLYVVGCQRSGTSMLHHLFRLDWSTVTYDEVSPLSAGDDEEHLRWTSLDLVRDRIGADRAPFVVAKPLVESQQLDRLLDLFGDTRAIWMWRGYLDVATSNLAFFGEGNGHEDLQHLLGGEGPSWKRENLAPATVERIRAAYGPNLAPLDAAALFWYARNSLFFERGLDADPRVALCSYDELANRPGEVMRRAYAHVGRPYPGNRIIADVQAPRRRNQENAVLDATVASMCNELQERLASIPGI